MDLDASQPSQSGVAAPVMHTVYLALGSNLGDRRAHLAAALQHLRELMEITAVSSIYETEPVGYLEQPRFLNMVCCVRTTYSASALLRHVKEIETAIGRQPSFRNGPRPIDIDLILYDTCQIIEDELIIPHPRMAERAFVLAPLAEIAPSVIDPVSGRTARQLLETETEAKAVSQDGVKKLAPD